MVSDGGWPDQVKVGEAYFSEVNMTRYVLEGGYQSVACPATRVPVTHTLDQKTLEKLRRL